MNSNSKLEKTGSSKALAEVKFEPEADYSQSSLNRKPPNLPSPQTATTSKENKQTKKDDKEWRQTQSYDSERKKSSEEFKYPTSRSIDSKGPRVEVASADYGLNPPSPNMLSRRQSFMPEVLIKKEGLSTRPSPYKTKSLSRANSGDLSPGFDNYSVVTSPGLSSGTESSHEGAIISEEEDQMRRRKNRIRRKSKIQRQQCYDDENEQNQTYQQHNLSVQEVLRRHSTSDTAVQQPGPRDSLSIPTPNSARHHSWDVSMSYSDQRKGSDSSDASDMSDRWSYHRASDGDVYNYNNMGAVRRNSTYKKIRNPRLQDLEINDGYDADGQTCKLF